MSLQHTVIDINSWKIDRENFNCQKWIGSNQIRIVGNVSSVSGGDESSSDLISYRTRFRITALDHLNVVTLVQAKKRHELLDTVQYWI